MCLHDALVYTQRHKEGLKNDSVLANLEQLKE
jgi:hypothetical protein